eukprot:CAMPEP_0172490140 /NCGR_PEP_ID=MMETSP1066-20121228/20474_1 /TAXON_ID=671091 /ORGANISM="Coscinodiscus wailesii, Strain CCMP2513" /LENGTH=189 /DNA_ID=CAMNT_0013258457 /DNA_START=68 /DNA_END=634 /DNA_ORIENTATION=-
MKLYTGIVIAFLANYECAFGGEMTVLDCDLTNIKRCISTDGCRVFRTKVGQTEKWACLVKEWSSFIPTSPPSKAPSLLPSLKPSLAPSFRPSLAPSFRPSLAPSFQPSLAPSFRPTIVACGSEEVNQTDYRGTLAVTVSGRTCGYWFDEEIAMYPEAGLEENYCRNPNDSYGPGLVSSVWCYLSDGYDW